MAVSASSLASDAVSGPNPELVGECPHCHHNLERREVTDERRLRAMVAGVGALTEPLILMAFWACMNQECCSMFWRRPRRT